jgi:hypothetical protein
LPLGVRILTLLPAVVGATWGRATVSRSTLPPHAEARRLFDTRAAYVTGAARAYPLLEPLAAQTPSPRTSRDSTVIVLENAHLRLMLLPLLGGAIVAVHDKTTGTDVLRASALSPRDTAAAFPPGLYTIGPSDENPAEFLSACDCTTAIDTAGAGVRCRRVDRTTGMVLETFTRLPHEGFFIERQTRLINATSEARKGMLWSATAIEVDGAMRLVLPSDRAVAPRPLTIHGPRGAIRRIGELTPFPYPLIDSAGRMRPSRWSDSTGIYAAGLQRPWGGMHDGRGGRGVLTLPGESAGGLGFESRRGRAVLYTGVNRTPGRYLPVNQGDTLALCERIVPATGLRRVGEVQEGFVLGAYRTGDSLVAEARLFDAAALVADSFTLILEAGGVELGRTRATARAGQRCTLRARRRPGTLRVRTVAGVSVQAILTIPENTVWTLDTAGACDTPGDTAAPVEAITVEAPPAEPVRMSTGGWDGDAACAMLKRFTFHRCVGATRTGDTLYLLCEDTLRILRDDTRPHRYPFFVESHFAASIDTARLSSEAIGVSAVPLEPRRWSADILWHHGRLLLSRDKHIELRDGRGALLDTIAVGGWAGPMAPRDSATILVSLPLRHAIAVVDLDNRSVETTALGRFRHPWALTAVPGGWALSSISAKEVAILDERGREKRFIRVPAAEPWNRSVRGVPALAYHPPTRCLLAADPDNLRIVKTTLDGESVGTFAGGGLERGEILMVLDMAYRAGEGLLVTQSYPRCGGCVTVKLLDDDGRLTGSVGVFASGSLQRPVHAFPYARNELVCYDYSLGGLAVADTLGRLVGAVGGHGWGTGLAAGVPGDEDGRSQGFVFDRGFGGFVADVARRRVLRFSTDLRLVEELVPPGEELLFTPVALTLDAAGNLHVLDGLQNVIVRFRRLRARLQTKDGYRYDYDRRYRPPEGVTLQRLYSQGNLVVGVDLFANRAYRFNANGWLEDSLALPPGFAASSRWTVNGEGELVVVDESGAAVTVLSARGTVAAYDIPPLPGELLTFQSLVWRIGWQWAGMPRRARYLCLSTTGAARYLDEGFGEVR